MEQTLLLLEDNIEHCQHLQKMICEYNDYSDNSSFKIILTTSLAEAKKRIEDRIHIDAFLLDISMDDTPNNSDGLDFAKQLHSIEHYKNTPILFITAYGSFLPKAINELHCYAFLMKPYSKQALFQQLHDLANLKKNNLFIKTRDGIYYKLSSAEIIYIQSQGRYLKFVTTNDCFYSRQHTLNQIADQLPANFVRCHRSYIINTDVVINFDFLNHYVSLQGVENRIPLSRTQKAENFMI